HNTLIFGTALVPNIGGGAPDGIVLGRLGQGVGKNGNNPPWILLPHDEADLGKAQAWLVQDASSGVTQPATTQAPPTQTGFGAPATPAAPAWGGQAPAPAAPAWGAPQVTPLADILSQLAAKGVQVPPGTPEDQV